MAAWLCGTCTVCAGRCSALSTSATTWVAWQAWVAVRPTHWLINLSFSHHAPRSYVMPDGRSVYMTDDGSNKFFSIFVMDRVNDLSSGTIYAAVMTQISSKDGGE